jgi:hypothetical protein
MVRSACPRIAAALLAGLIAVNVASAQELPAPSLRDAAQSQVLPAAAPGIGTAGSGLAPQRRPGALFPLYVSFGTLQVLDTHSTSRAITSGAVEANPMMKGIAGNEAAMLAVKAAGTAGVIFASEKIWKRNRTAAVIFMIATNAGMAWVVQNNYRAAH